MTASILILGGGSASEDFEELFRFAQHRIQRIESTKEIAVRSAKGSVSLVVWDRDGSGGLFEDIAGTYQDLAKAGVPYLVVSSDRTEAGIYRAFDHNARDYILRPFNHREFILRTSAVLNQRKRIACLGGGTGLFTLLTAIKEIRGTLVASVVSMADDGGSSGRLRTSFGMLPPGDVRRSLVALSNAPEQMNEIMQYRFKRGKDLKGHSFGNLFLTALSEINGSMAEAVRHMGDILNVRGIVMPISSAQTSLCARFEDGRIVRGESCIDLCEKRAADLRITDVWLEPEVSCDPNALTAILWSDLVAIGPGDLFTSVVVNLCVNGIREALRRTHARRLYVCNLMSKPGETLSMDSAQHTGEITRYLGEDILDLVLVSDTRIRAEAAALYAKKGQYAVAVNPPADFSRLTRAQIVYADIGHDHELVRHDPAKLRQVLSGII